MLAVIELREDAKGESATYRGSILKKLLISLGRKLLPPIKEILQFVYDRDLDQETVVKFSWSRIKSKLDQGKLAPVTASRSLRFFSLFLENAISEQELAPLV